MGRVGEVMGVFDESAVTVKKNCRVKVLCPGIAAR